MDDLKYDPNLMQAIPAEVLAAERLISEFFDRLGSDHWTLGGIQKRVYPEFKQF